MKSVAKYLHWLGILAAFATPAFAEPRTISWNPVTTYTDGTPIEVGKTVSYSAYWTTDPGLGSLRTIGTGIPATSTTFDPGVQGMTRGGTVYFTAKAVLNTGEESALSPAYAWVVPLATAPAVPKNIGITGPISTGTSQVWRLNWDPVTTYANGASLEPGRTVRYTVYWTYDPALTPGSLRLLASSVPATTVDFDPLAYPMVRNRLIYLTAQSVLDTGDQSSFSASIEWVVANAGPAPPAGGIIIKK